MQDIPIGALSVALVFLIFLSAFFSAAEIAVMSLNRYRLRSLEEKGHAGAIRISRLLEQPDRLLGIILLGNNFVNNAAAAITTILAIRLYGESVVLAAATILTLVILIFAEVGPKTLAAIRPESIAFPAGVILRPLLKFLSPVIWLINMLSNQMLRVLGVNLDVHSHALSRDELHAAVREAGALIPKSHQAMLLGILDLEKITVDEVMVPRNRIKGIDLDQKWDDILQELQTSRYSRLPVYRGSLDNIKGMLHVRDVINLAGNNNLTLEGLLSIISEPYFIPKGTPLNTQLINFRKTRRRRGLVVDEYGDILGLVTLEEILEEIVGEFTTRTQAYSEAFRLQEDGSYIVKGSATVRNLNKKLGWHLPTKGPHTLNGLITDYLETIPEPGTSLMLNGYTVDIIRTRGTAVEIARIVPQRLKEDRDEKQENTEKEK